MARSLPTLVASEFPSYEILRIFRNHCFTALPLGPYGAPTGGHMGASRDCAQPDALPLTLGQLGTYQRPGLARLWFGFG